MGKKIRITRKTLREDEIRSGWFEFLAWLQRHSRQVLLGSGIVLVALFSLQVRSCAKANQLARANMAISRAELYLRSALVAQNEQVRDRRLADAQSDLELVAPRGGKLGAYANYLLGNIALFRNQYDEAEGYYNAYLGAATGPTEKADGYIALGYTYENKFFWTNQRPEDRVWLDHAMESYQKAEDLTSGTLEHYMAMLGRARLDELQPGHEAEAQELYDRTERERQLGPIKHSTAFLRSPYEPILADSERIGRLFTLAETARLRRERLEAGE